MYKFYININLMVWIPLFNASTVRGTDLLYRILIILVCFKAIFSGIEVLCRCKRNYEISTYLLNRFELHSWSFGRFFFNLLLFWSLFQGRFFHHWFFRFHRFLLRLWFLPSLFNWFRLSWFCWFSLFRSSLSPGLGRLRLWLRLFCRFWLFCSWPGW